MSAPNYQATGAAISAVGAVAWPTHQANDIGLLVVECAGNQSVSLSTANGFAELPSSPVTADSSSAGTKLQVFWCRATSSSMASPVLSGAANHCWARIITIRGCPTSGNPWNVSGTASKATASTTTTWPSITTIGANSLVLLLATRETDSAAAAWSLPVNTNLTSITEQVDDGTITGNGGGMVVATGVRAVPGSIGTTTATVTSSLNAAIILAFPEPNDSPTVALNTADATTTTDTTPTLLFTGSDTESNPATYEVQIDPTNTFDSVASGTLAKVQAAGLSNSSISPGTITMPAALTAHNFVAVAVCWPATTAGIVSSISDGVNTYRKAKTQQGASGVTVEIWYAYDVQPASALSLLLSTTSPITLAP
jgi:hypothetical protein